MNSLWRLQNKLGQNICKSYVIENTLSHVERVHDAITLYGNEYIAYDEPLSAIISNMDELSIAFRTSQQTTFIAVIGNYDIVIVYVTI